MRAINVFGCINLFLLLILRWIFCKEASNKWIRLNTADTIYGTFMPVEGQLSSAQCLTKCTETQGCVSVYVQRENLQCELSEQNILDKSLTPNQRPGWTAYNRGGRNCKDVMDAGDKISGFKTIFPDGIHPVNALCIMNDDVDGGGWTVIQRRETSSNFYQDWQKYRDGFGDNVNLWIGLENIHRLTLPGNFELRVDLIKNDGSHAAAKYQTFAVGSEAEGYILSVGGYSYDPNFVNPGDSITALHNGMKFSTYDRDNDFGIGSCALASKGGYWYRNCQDSNLNGEYGSTAYGVGINWLSWTGHNESLKYTRMMIRPK